MANETPNSAEPVESNTPIKPPVLDIVQEKPIGDDAIMITLYRGRVEVTAVAAEDGRDAVIQAAKLILNQAELLLGDVLLISRV